MKALGFNWLKAKVVSIPFCFQTFNLDPYTTGHLPAPVPAAVDDEAATAMVPGGQTPTTTRPTASACVTLKGLRKAQTSLEDFVASYFMFHGLDSRSPADVFPHLPVLAFTEAGEKEEEEVHAMQAQPRLLKGHDPVSIFQTPKGDGIAFNLKPGGGGLSA